MSSVKKILIAMVAVFIAAIVAWSMTSSLIVHAADDEDTTEYSLAQLSESAAKFFSYVMSPENGGNDDSGYKQMNICAPEPEGMGLDFTTAGGMLGFVDPDATKRETVNFWTSAGSTKNQTEYPYLFLAGIKDSKGNRPFYEYAKYGYALNQMGIDQTGNPSASTGLRWFVGLIMMILYIGSAFVNVVFSFALTLLQYANPFRLFAGKTSIGTGNGILEGMDGIEALSNKLGKDTAGGAIAAGVSQFAVKLRELYKVSSGVGTAIVLPILTAFMIASITLLHGKPVGNKRTVWDKMKPWVLRLVFLVLGVPLMFSCYDIVLGSLQDQVAASNQTGTRMIASTFVDFDVWATDYGLELPIGVQLYIGTDGELKDTQGLSTDARNLAYKINYMTGAFGSIPSTMDGTSLGREESMIENTYVWNNNNDASVGSMTYKNNIATNFSNIMDVVEELQKYMNGDMITASSYEGSVVKSRLSTKTSKAQLEKLREMFLDGSNWENYLKTTDGDNESTQRLWKAYSGYSSYAKGMNVFASNATMQNDYKNSSDKKSIMFHGYRTASGQGSVVDLIGRLITGDSSTHEGFSDLAMYNYLNSSFTDTSIIVYSPNTSSSAVTRQNHYAVNNVGGNGLLKVLYLIDAMAVMGCVAILGYVYAFGLIMANFKAMFKVIPNIFLGVAGSIKAIATVVAYTIAMCLEVIITIFLYCFNCGEADAYYV